MIGWGFYFFMLRGTSYISYRRSRPANFYFHARRATRIFSCDPRKAKLSEIGHGGKKTGAVKTAPLGMEELTGDNFYLTLPSLLHGSSLGRPSDQKLFLHDLQFVIS